MIDRKQTVCVLTHGQTWLLRDEQCTVTPTRADWTLVSTSRQDGFACASRCMRFNNSIGVTRCEATVPSRHPCAPWRNFLSHGRAIFRGGESCRIRVNGLFWELGLESRQSTTECGARCVQFRVSQD